MDSTIRVVQHAPSMHPSPDVVVRRLDGAGVLVHLPTNRIFELNETAMRVWELLGEDADAARIGDHLTREYDIEPSVAATEVSTLLRRFRDEGFVES